MPTKKKTKRKVSRNGLAAEVVLITPQLAQELMEVIGHGSNMRKLQPVLVHRYARAMSEGRWALTGDSIKLAADDDSVVDGQHRLAAVMQSGQSVPMLVVRGVDPSDMIYCNVGQTKKLAQVLSKRGVQYAGMVASISKILLHYQRMGTFGALYTPDARLCVPDAAETQLFYEKHRAAITRSAQAVAPLHRFLPQAFPGALHYTVARGNRELADTWAEGIATGADLSKLDPRYRLRERGFTQRASKQGWHQKFLAALAIKCWNQWYTGTPCRALIWRDSTEEFPEPLIPQKTDGIPVIKE